MNSVALTPAPRKSRKPVSRSIKLALPPFEGNPGVVEITVGKETKRYFLKAIPSDFGRAFNLEKIDPAGEGEPENYNVNLADTPDGRDSCECLGHLHHGRCKHTAGLAALVQAGRL